ncbi:MAG: transglycosylase domain-containing protein [Oscillospiraceae bacterium]
MRFIGVCICLGIMAASVMAVLLSMYLVKVTANDAQRLDLNNLKLSYTSTIMVKTNKTPENPEGEWTEYQRLVGDENRVWVNLDEIPVNLQNAFISIEDKDFWTSPGFSFKRTVYAALNELSHAVTGKYLGGSKQGASTIHQQLIKNITTDDKQDIMRKVREIFRAVSLNNKFSKEMVLEAYLNTIGLHGNVAGVQAGAHSIFNKDVKELTIAECATIAAITKNPTEYNPTTNPARNQERRNDVLYYMHQQGKITDAEYQEALASPLVISERKTVGTSAKVIYNNWAVDKVLEDVILDMQTKLSKTNDEANRSVYNDGLTIYATFDPVVQAEMEKVAKERKMYPSFEQEIVKKDKVTGKPILDEAGKTSKVKIKADAAMITLNYKGEIVGVIGSLNDKTGDRVFSNATDMKRAVGSTMKGVTVYPLAIEDGPMHYSWAGAMDSPFKQIPDPETGEMRDWPQNYDKKYLEVPLTVEEAIRRSVNTIAVRVGDIVTPRAMFDFAYDTLEIKSLDITKDVDLGPMCLGSLSHGMTPLELAGAYMMYGNKGKFITPHSYTSVTNSYGEVILEPDVTEVQAISEETAYIMNRLLYNVLGPGGTAPGLRTKTTDGVGKTGTTNETKDVWYVGITPNYVMSTWLGYAENEPMDPVYNANKIKHPGASYWREVMDNIQEGTTNKDFEVCPTVVKLPYCKASGGAVGPLCTDVAEGYYKPDTVLDTCTAPGHY